MSDLISRKETIDAILKLAKEPSVQRNPDSVNGLLGAYNIVYEKPSADIIDHARAIKEYCKYPNCNECKFAKHTEWHNGLWFSCKLHNPCYDWDLPEEEKDLKNKG